MTHWEFRCYNWKGEPFFAVYCDGARLGVLRGGRRYAHALAHAVRGTVIELGEVREAKTIAVEQTTTYPAPETLQ